MSRNATRKNNGKGKGMKKGMKTVTKDILNDDPYKIYVDPEKDWDEFYWDYLELSGEFEALQKLNNYQASIHNEMMVEIDEMSRNIGGINDEIHKFCVSHQELSKRFSEILLKRISAVINAMNKGFAQCNLDVPKIELVHTEKGYEIKTTH